MENLPFKTTEFQTAWNDWLEYRKQRKLPKYVPKGLQKTFAALLRISGNNQQTAILIIEQSMELNYQGLFPLKNVNNGTTHQRGDTKPPVTKLGTSDARAEALKNW